MAEGGRRAGAAAGPAADAAVRRRLRGKQSPPDGGLGAICDLAISAESWREIAWLAEDAQRQHVHYVHVRTHSETDVQPHQFTREEFYRHIERVYREEYPEPANKHSGSIALFGMVVKEWHAESADTCLRDEHHHCAVFASKRHFWRKIARRSYETYRVKLHAAAHEGYATMYRYLTQASPKKPMSEIDAQRWFSEMHPQGDKLRCLLEAGATHERAFQGRKRRSDCATEELGSRNVFQVIKANGLRSATALEAYACAEESKGRAKLAEFCTKNGHKLPAMVHQAWAVMSAPERLAWSSMTLIEKLAKQAEALPCECAGSWTPGALAILERNEIPASAFAGAVRRALEVGARRGVNVACVGAGGCGKSTLIEPLEKVFQCFPKPQAGSTFSLTGIAECDIALWQDYDHNEKTVCFTDLLSVFAGESFGCREPGCRNVKTSNKAPLFYSGHARLRCGNKCMKVRDSLNAMMDERFTIFEFTNPIPRSSRIEEWPHCGRCAAAFYLKGPPASTESASSSAGPRPSPVSRPAEQAPSPGGLIAALQDLAQLRAAGTLNDQEFSAAKQLLLGSATPARAVEGPAPVAQPRGQSYDAEEEAAAFLLG